MFVSFINLNDMFLSVRSYARRIAEGTPIVLLHGFSGSSLDFTFLQDTLDDCFDLYAVDLPGHGLSSSPEDPEFYTAEAMTGQLHKVISSITKGRVILLGYSMGGRAALQYAVRHPEKIKALILESATPGIPGQADRNLRMQSDLKLADFITANPLERFVDYWMNIPLFSSQKTLGGALLEKERAGKMRNNRTGIANSLRGFSTGRMPHLWDRLERLDFPSLLITGGLDNKFTGIARGMHSILGSCGLENAHVIIQNAGHNVHLEKPEAFVHTVETFLKNVE